MRRMTLFAIAIAALGLAVAGATSTQADSRCQDCTRHHNHRTPIPVQMISMRRTQPPIPQFEAPLPQPPAPQAADVQAPAVSEPVPVQPAPPVEQFLPEAPPMAEPAPAAAPKATASTGCKTTAPCGKVACASEGCASEGCASEGCASEGCATNCLGKASKSFGGIGSLLKGIKCPVGTGGLGIARCTDGGCSDEPGCASEEGCSDKGAGCADEGCGIARCTDGKCIGGLLGSLLDKGKCCSLGSGGCSGGDSNDCGCEKDSGRCGCGPNGNGCCLNGGNGCGPAGGLCGLCNSLGGKALGLCPGCGGAGCHGAFPDAGWAMPAAAPILRSPIQYSRYLPAQPYGTPGAVPAAGYPTIYRPMDTTQLGFGYHNVPYWQPNPAMLPPMPHPAAMHSRVCPNGMMGSTMNCNTGNCYGQVAPNSATGMALKPVPEPQPVAQQLKKPVPAKQVSRNKPLNAKRASLRR